jgi:very-long-chain ceramide synthase
MGIWFYMRHWTNLRILWSILTQFSTIGPYELNWETQQYKCALSQAITFTLLFILQSLNSFWFFLICRVAYRFVISWGEDVKDERSEYEESEEEVENEKERTPKAKANGAVKMNGSANGAAHGTPKVMLNGEPVPRTPSPRVEVEEPGTIGSRLRERKRGQK